MTTTFSISRDTIISSALRKLQVIELGSTPDANTITNAAQALNVMIKTWQTQGIKLWTIGEIVLPLVATKRTYTIGPASDLVANKPLKVIQAWAQNISVTPNIRTPLQILSRQEYNILGSPDSPGMINSVWYEPGATIGTLTTYLNPDTATATNYVIYLVTQRAMTDVTLSSDIPDFPNEWTQALIWGLADELSLEYGCLENQRREINAKATSYRTAMEDNDVDTTSTFFSPDPRARGK